MRAKLITNVLLVLGLTVHIATANATGLTESNSNNGSATQGNNNSCPCTLGTIPMNEANLSDAAILVWANEVAVSLLSYNFVNYRSEFQKSSGFFTPNGFDTFLAAIDKSNSLALVETKKFIVSAVATKPPIIVHKGIINNLYSWKVEIPMLITYQNQSEFQQANNIVTLLITRAPAINAPRGIAVAKFTVAPEGKNDNSKKK